MNIKKYIKNPAPVEALKWTRQTDKDWEDIKEFIGGHGEKRVFVTPEGDLQIRTSDWWIYARLGDYLMKDIEGKFHSCSAKEFEQKYKLPKEWG